MNIKHFINFSELSIADLDAWREDGGTVAGVYCIYAPTEVIRAANVAPISLCGKKQDPIKEAERELPPSLCPLIKSSYGYAINGTCPFFSASDVLIAETTCDGKKKMYELMGRLKPLHLMQLPHTQTGEAALQYWLHGLHELAAFLTSYSGTEVTDEALAREIAEQNAIRSELARVAQLAADDRSPLTAGDLLAIQESKSFSVYPHKYLAALTELRRDLEAHLAQPNLPAKSNPRILLTGCPSGKGSDKLINIIDELGGRVVCMENCTGLKGMTLPVDETGDPWEALAQRYLSIPCSCMSPNANRLTSLQEMAEAYRVDAIIDLTWLGCHTYNAESTTVKRFVEGELGLPFLRVETDYSTSDTEQLRTRVEAFIEIL